MRMRRSNSGTMTPTAAAHSRLISVAAAMMAAIFQVPYQTMVTAPTMTAQMRPLSPPTAISFHSSQRALTHSTWPSAMPRMISVTVWVPAMPPMLATMGMSAASAATFSMVPSKRLTTAAARNAVTRLMPSHTQAPARRREDAGEHVFLVAQTGRGHDFVRGFLADHVDDVVDRDAAEQLALLVDHRRRHEVAVLEQLRDVVRVGLGRDARAFRIEDVADGFLRVFGQQARERERAQVPVVAVDDEQAVGLVGQLAAHAQVTQHHFDGDVGAHAHRVGVHEAAGGVVLEGQHGLQPLAVLLVHRLDELQRYGFGQVADEVGEIVELHVFGGREQFVGVHAVDEGLAHVVAELDEHVAFDLGLDEVPDHLALRGRQRFDEQRDLRRMHRRDHAGRATPRTFAQRAAQRREAALFAGDDGGVDHFGASVLKWGGGVRVWRASATAPRARMSSLSPGPSAMC